MLTLQTVSENIRTGAKWIGLGIGAIVIIMIVLGVGKNLKELISPTPKAPPTVEFGLLPEVLFPISVTSEKLNYSLNTLSGSLPAFSDRIAVHPTIYNSPNLLALQRAREKVNQLGFTTNPVLISPTVYSWNNSELGKKIVLNTLDYTFTLTSDYLNNPFVLTASNLPKESEAITKSRTLMEFLGDSPDDIDEKSTKSTLLSIRNSEMIPATSFSNTQIIRVDFYQKNIDETPIVYNNPPFSNMSFFVTGGQSEGQISNAEFFHTKIATESATYPIKTAGEAFEDLKKGNVYIASLEGNPDLVTIKDVFLAYFIGNEKQEYLWPVVVFKGDNNFYGYVSAVKSDWIKKANEQ